MQPIELTTRDRLLLHGFLTLPAGQAPFPLIVLPHGGPHGIADQWTFNPEAQLFASRGYAVLQINYRGSGGYGSNFISRGFRQWGLSMQDDLTDATRWAIQQGYADAAHICIYGASYGGYAALEGAVREPDLYKCAIGYDGVYDLRVQLARSDTELTDRGDAYLKLALGTDPDDLLRRSPVSGAARIKADILLIHGGQDPRAPFKHFQELVKALQDNGKHYETLVEPDEGHGFFLPQHKQAAYARMLDFLDRHIGSPGNASGPAAPASVSGH
nr:alpha/beta fold hydrolase [Dyella acidiphila]